MSHRLNIWFTGTARSTELTGEIACYDPECDEREDGCPLEYLVETVGLEDFLYMFSSKQPIRSQLAAFDVTDINVDRADYPVATLELSKGSKQ